jgi:antitoxin MazE
MQTKIQKWGNSLAVRIAKSMAEELRLEPDSPVEIRVEKGRLTILPLSKQVFDLETLLAEIKPENLHAEIDSGPPQGNEVW